MWLQIPNHLGTRNPEVPGYIQKATIFSEQGGAKMDSGPSSNLKVEGCGAGIGDDSAGLNDGFVANAIFFR
jgi:hypothetical protein